MKPTRFILLIIMILCILSGCSAYTQTNIAATTLPVWQFTQILCEGTPLRVARLISEEVSCLHDYSLSVRQMRTIEDAEIIVISGAGLEDFLGDALSGQQTTIDASAGVSLLETVTHHHEENHHTDHHHETDPHIWLSPLNAKEMAQNICAGLCLQYPQYEQVFRSNLSGLLQQLDELIAYGQTTLAELNCREIVTFHDGFSYLAQAFDLEILEAIEEESGSEVSAAELIHLITLVEEHELSVIFTETNGADSAAGVISAETGAALYTLDMAMSGDDYFESMYRNIDILKEALS